ncbi:F-box only protein 9 isoform X1 [Neodiprion pinetum]|uniref:F-box only protein 9 n=1 Tax=Neodiprion lecontei TaxID=441921 RepID=A0ABM3GE36_NEOLC|nr:F-box only protein 9 isoform X1 [Neodiprion pinetum]XP_046598542.1 F-box only protein 9 isoform X1 [Neodiprion lecontei]XP_046621124.1 F-box only protein 9 isoform X1 [Neodiprion virginianus]
MSQTAESGKEVDESNDDQEDFSLSHEENVENTLASFRERWQRELEISPRKEPNIQVSQISNNIPSEGDSASIENKAKTLFLKGIENEQNGKLYEAIQFYKRAVQLIPDIEFRLYESTKPKTRERLDPENSIEVQDKDPGIEMDEEEDNEDDGDLLTKITRIICKNQRVCSPQFEQSTTHISALPMEIILYILRWVVSSELDLRSLEVFAKVCRGFFVSARDDEIWRLACIKAWGVNCGTFEPDYKSWRQMFVERPRLRYNGCYISKTSYVRHGENSFQDQFYRPWHLVEYFRYLRFFPEGRVLMLTSADEAQSCVNSLKQRNPKNPSVLIGHYRLHLNCVILVLKSQETKTNNNAYRRRRRDPIHDSGEKTFHLEFEIQNLYKRANSQLAWKTYNIFTKYWNGQENSTCLNLAGSLYPAFKFSRVKSYTMESESPLQ